jgi:hypothetical protein
MMFHAEKGMLEDQCNDGLTKEYFIGERTEQETRGWIELQMRSSMICAFHRIQLG